MRPPERSTADRGPASTGPEILHARTAVGRLRPPARGGRAASLRRGSGGCPCRGSPPRGGTRGPRTAGPGRTGRPGWELAPFGLAQNVLEHQDVHVDQGADWRTRRHRTDTSCSSRRFEAISPRRTRCGASTRTGTAPTGACSPTSPPAALSPEATPPSSARSSPSRAACGAHPRPGRPDGLSSRQDRFRSTAKTWPPVGFADQFRRGGPLPGPGARPAGHEGKQRQGPPDLLGDRQGAGAQPPTGRPPVDGCRVGGLFAVTGRHIAVTARMYALTRTG
ncbi:hypothetical protein K353_06585 [Kitasatospora sp. SolWspMP-SS2h]|nr:hypothetical protein K353_06585 [Kitasatospora sp. SolWspMP-SS2h]